MWFDFLVLLAALALDFKFSEVRHHHPLVYFGNMASSLEKCLNLFKSDTPARVLKALGVIAWALAVVPLVYLSYWLEQWLATELPVFIAWLYAACVLYIAIGWRSLLTHARAISQPLKTGDINGARQALSMIVSRDTGTLDSQQISNGATESVLENGADAIFCAIFWFLLLGVPGVVLYRLANTLDAMWGYKYERYLYFGWAAARIDDVLNFIPARLCAYSYALLGNYRLARQCWREQGLDWKSPNAGPVMAAGAGALNVRLGGGSYYQGQWQERPLLGPETGRLPSALAVEDSCLLVNRVLALWVVLLLLMALLF